MHRVIAPLATALVLLAAANASAQVDDLAAREELALREAVERVAPSVVKIEAIVLPDIIA